MHDEEMAIAIVAIVFGVPMVVMVSNIVMRNIVKIVCHSRDVSLKIRLADRGMTAYEIEQIVNSGRTDGKRVASTPVSASVAAPAKPPRADYALKY